VREGRSVFDNIRKFLRFLLSSNLGEVLTVFLGVVGAGLLGLNVGDSGAVTLPILATQLLWINLVTDSWPALALGIDPPVDDMMDRKPRRSTDRLIDTRMWLDMVEVGLVVAAATLLTIDIYLPGGLIAGGEDLATARTAGFTVLVFASLFVSLISRSDTASAFRQLFANRWLWAAIAVSVLLQVTVVHIPFLNMAFGTVPLSFEQWLVCAAMASSVLWLSELRKWGARLWAGRRAAPASASTD
jgi:magnesium-transporting ATPase (P-type)